MKNYTDSDYAVNKNAEGTQTRNYSDREHDMLSSKEDKLNFLKAVHDISSQKFTSGSLSQVGASLMPGATQVTLLGFWKALRYGGVNKIKQYSRWLTC